MFGHLKGIPISVIGKDTGYHIGGSDASGIVWAVGDNVKRWKVGMRLSFIVIEMMVMMKNVTEENQCIQNLKEFGVMKLMMALLLNLQQFNQDNLLKKPEHLSWEESGCYTLTLATSYRMLFGHPPHALKPGMNILVWGASGGIGSMAVQICKAVGS